MKELHVTIITLCDFPSPNIYVFKSVRFLVQSNYFSSALLRVVSTSVMNRRWLFKGWIALSIG